ncbi:MAG: UDP-4-amino-4,6-dideoxy-N-acetyl-beta-L-altrosamine N-acetyltransferase [Brevundimonas sp.]|uniref:UDP-4-amino-4, 6-dideoxy-N-acetyl-beta-L-altrosamine N-acetyltransferase n=1 Tax=Brevundimonas sp. TaxID=1871086 RepID=UPI002489180E|nr:UDP-4-amino-4,6-dideoxy-N-acetyl-beta-L-altrosamine N-acetyltransferase [Brevundimonas sp.]MDI1325515.1 UDP-4-amino-4,6-dideoxy-N-acetyl-beta-L-altrosamine N-acetyltransferase [Brevundimonas sp.]
MAVRLRRVLEQDLETIRHWRMLPDITKYMYTDPEITPESQMLWHQRISASDRDKVWLIQLSESETDVGLLSLNDIDPVHRRCCWAYYIAEEAARGKGLAKTLECNIYDYAFFTLDLNRVWCEVLGFNEKVVKLHELFGCKVEGVLREHVIKDGTRHDVVRMGILRDEWTSAREKFSYSKIEIEE